MSEPRRGRPRIPFYKDEKVGGVTAAISLRVFVIAVFAAVVVFGILLDYVIDLSKSIQHTQSDNHKSRVADQKRNDLHIRQLYCNQAAVIHSIAPSNQMALRYAREIEEMYKCDLKNPASPIPSSPSTHSAPSKASTSPKPHGLAKNSPTPTQPKATSQAKAAPAVRVTPTPGPSPSSPSSSPKALLTVPKLCVGQLLCT